MVIPFIVLISYNKAIEWYKIKRAVKVASNYFDRSFWYNGLSYSNKKIHQQTSNRTKRLYT